jgi:hypothetical protein
VHTLLQVAPLCAYIITSGTSWCIHYYYKWHLLVYTLLLQVAPLGVYIITSGTSWCIHYYYKWHLFVYTLLLQVAPLCVYIIITSGTCHVIVFVVCLINILFLSLNVK